MYKTSQYHMQKKIKLQMCEEEFRSEPLTRHLCLSHISSGRRRISGDLRVFQISGHRRKILRDSNDVQNTQSHLARMSLR